MAYAMHAGRVVFIGFDQRNRHHFYDLRERHFRTIKSHMRKLKAMYSDDKEMIASIEDHERKALYADKKTLDLPFPGKPIVPKLRFYLMTLENAGVQIINTLRGSVIEKAGTMPGGRMIVQNMKLQDIV
jgi:hypothetical protein